MTKRKETKPMAKQTADDVDVFQLLDEFERLKPAKIDALKGEIDDRLQKLARLGVNMKLVDASTNPAKSEKRPAGKTSAPSTANRPPMPEGPAPEGGWKFCPQHGWGDHDGRKHRVETIAANKKQADAATV